MDQRRKDHILGPAIDDGAVHSDVGISGRNHYEYTDQHSTRARSDRPIGRICTLLRSRIQEHQVSINTKKVLEMVERDPCQIKSRGLISSPFEITFFDGGGVVPENINEEI